MFKLIDLVRTNKDEQFWDEDSGGMILKDLQFLSSGLFSLNSNNTTISQLGKFSITSGSKLVYEKIENKSFKDLRYVSLIEVRCENIENDAAKAYGFVLRRGKAHFEIYTRTKATYQTWSELFKHFTIQHDFDRQFIIKDLYEKEQGMIYALCQRMKGKGKEAYLAKFVETSLLIEDIEAYLYEIRLSRCINSSLFSMIVGVYEHQEFMVIVYRIRSDISLRAYIVKHNSLQEKEIEEIIGNLVLAISDAHRNDIILRQLNPEMIFIDPLDLSLTICDLSGAVFKSDFSRPFIRSCIGFIAPEIVEDTVYSKRADVFSLGVIIYMLISKSFPFRDSDTAKVLNKSVLQTSVDHLVCSQPLKELASECLKKDPTKRISIKELASKGFVKAKLMEISEKIILSHRADEGKSPLEKFSSLNQEKEYTSIRSDAHKLTATTGVEVHLSELNNAASIKMELIKNELEKVQKKGTLTNGFRLGAVVSNFMKRPFYRTLANGKPKHFINSYTDQAMVLSLGIPEEEGIETRQFSRCLVIGNRFKQLPTKQPDKL